MALKRGRQPSAASADKGKTKKPCDAERATKGKARDLERASWPTVLRPKGPRSAAALDPQLAKVDAAELVRRFLAPLDLSTFLQKAWGRSCVALPGPVERIETLCDDFLHGLDLEALLSSTASESVSVWFRKARGGKQIESVQVEPAAAVGLSQAGGVAFYFRAPEALEHLLVAGLLSGLGCGFAGHYPGDGKPRGEIEMFVSHRGHITGWHTDFQHNFTVQLRGTKRWRFKRGPIESGVRALTPHFRTRANVEQQMKCHNAWGAASERHVVEHRGCTLSFSRAVTGRRRILATVGLTSCL
eukprot:TRINITY_DN27668_c0_g1_i1.p1 TRINITY_DN27668_c0_g1~~TRINITY_DN27668_c0_g1_i1.p1  ORF type:complete len:301 (+),score=39.37 TRINITY_DN27668_c0_g1_i1:75-977(+)